MRDLDRKLLKETLKWFNKDTSHTKIDNPDILLDYLKIYNVKEIGEHWYDSSPPECVTCDIHVMEEEYGKYPCGLCPYWKHWSQTEDCLTKLTWIDIWGPELWEDITQKQTNEMYDHMIRNLLEEIDLTDRVYLFTLKGSTNIMIYIYLRDIKRCDYGFVLEKKEENEK